MPNTTLNAPFFGTFAPSFSFPTTNTLLSLFVSCCFVFVAGLIVVLNACFLHGDFLIEFSGVLTLGPYCLLHTVVYIPLSTYGFVKY